MTKRATIWLDQVGSRARRLTSCRIAGEETVRWFSSGADAIAHAKAEGCDEVLLWAKGLPVLLPLTPRHDLVHPQGASPIDADAPLEEAHNG